MAKVNRPMVGLGQRLYDLTYGRNLNMSELSRQTGVSRSLIWEYIYNGKNPSSFALMRICNYLNVSADYLLYGKGKEMTIADLYRWADERQYIVDVKCTTFGVDIKVRKDMWAMSYEISKYEIDGLDDAIGRALPIIQQKMEEVAG